MQHSASDFAVISLLKGFSSQLILSCHSLPHSRHCAVLKLVYFALKYLPMRPHIPHMQDADEMDRRFPSLRSHCLLLRCNYTHERQHVLPTEAFDL